MELGTATCGDRLPRERRDQPEDEAQESGDDHVVAPAARGRLRRGTVREHAREFDLLRLEELLLCGQRILQHRAEQNGERGVTRRTAADCVDLLLVGRDALLEQLDLLRSIAGKSVDNLSRERVDRDSRLARCGRLNGDLDEWILLDACGADGSGAPCRSEEHTSE